MKISVVIATYNRLSCLRANLEFLKNQDYQNYEIIVVNDGSTDKTTSYLKKLKHPHIRVFYSSHLGRSQAKNIGIYQAKGDIIAFIDDDCRAKKNWLSSLVKSFSDPAVVGAIGETRYVKDNYRGFFPEKVIQNPQGKWPMGGNCAFKKEALLKAKGFDNCLAINEDTDLAFRIIKFGKLISNPQAVVYHQKGYWTKADFLQSAKNLSVWAYFKKRYFNRFKNPFFKPPFWLGIIVEPKDYLYIIFCFIITPLMLIRFICNNYPRGQVSIQSIKLFLLKWPFYFILRRYYLWQKAWQLKVFTI